MLSFWVCATRHAKITPKKKFAYLCVSLENHGGKVDFLPANKYENFLQVDSITLGLCSQTCPKYPKQVYNIFVIRQGKRER